MYVFIYEMTSSNKGTLIFPRGKSGSTLPGRATEAARAKLPTPTSVCVLAYGDAMGITDSKIAKACSYSSLLFLHVQLPGNA